MLRDNMNLRRLPFLLPIAARHLLLSPSVVVVVTVDAKLFARSSLKDDDGNRKSSSPENKSRRRRRNGSHDEVGGSGGGIRERLGRFRGSDDEAPASAATTYEWYEYYVPSPAKYVDAMLLYIRSSLREMTFRHAGYRDVMMSDPRDIWEGLLSALEAMRKGYFGGVHSMIDGAYELGYGAISAFVSLVGGSDADSPLPYAFLSELFHGVRRGATCAADGFYLFAAGAVVGTRNLVVGICRTPEALRASRAGMIYYPQRRRTTADATDEEDDDRQEAVWDYYSLDREDAEIRSEEIRLRELNSDYAMQNERRKERTRNVRRRRASVHVKNKKYYNVLGVATDADPREIRSAYRREALRRHPDKQQAAHPPPNAKSLINDPHIEGFLDLTEAYRVLSDDTTRDAYDQHGLCFRKETSLPDEGGSDEDYVDLIDELFGANAVHDYVGDVQIAPIVNEMFGFKDSDSSRVNAEVRDLQQRRRKVEIAKHLRDRANPYVRGELTMEEFASSCRKEAYSILREGGEPAAAFLRVIGRTLSEEADQQTGRVLPFVRKQFSASGRRVRSSIANVRVYAPIYLRAALQSLVLGAHGDGGDDDAGDCSGDDRKSNKERADQDAVLDLLWRHVANDAVNVLRGACEKAFADRGAGDPSPAFVRTPSLMEHVKARRADAVRMLAREMLAASAEFSERAADGR